MEVVLLVIRPNCKDCCMTWVSSGMMSERRRMSLTIYRGRQESLFAPSNEGTYRHVYNLNLRSWVQFSHFCSEIMADSLYCLNSLELIVVVIMPSMTTNKGFHVSIHLIHRLESFEEIVHHRIGIETIKHVSSLGISSLYFPLFIHS